MSPLIAALLAFAVPASEGADPVAFSPAAVSAETAASIEKPVPKEDTAGAEKAAPHSPRMGSELRAAVRAAMRRWARPSDAQADRAAREFLTIYRELEDDTELSQSQRAYLQQRVRGRLMRLSDQITLRIAREKRLARSNASRPTKGAEQIAEAVTAPEASPGASPGNYVPEPSTSAGAFGGGAFQPADNGQQLVDLIQRVIRPETWDINGGPGSIYYWRPGRALVIRQMDEVHGQIGDVLGQLRRAGQ